MGDTTAPPTDGVCPADHGSSRDRGMPIGHLCDPCYAAYIDEADNRQAEDEGATAPPPPAAPACPVCGRDQDRWPTGYGRWILLEPRRLFLNTAVPAEQQWFIAHDGIAVNRRHGTTPLGDRCRIAHRLVCGHGPRPTNLAHAFTEAWLRNRADAGLPPGEPDAGDTPQ
ncbi:DUF6083 domain-containing protein [Streptomyces sp. KLMMK]|uniref:DUF6083 domain-containing protein n=1 Tax=Streptomyces sp. KLMMK TaxID=3109353 RepID=UPI00300B7C6F